MTYMRGFILPARDFQEEASDCDPQSPAPGSFNVDGCIAWMGGVRQIVASLAYLVVSLVIAMVKRIKELEDSTYFHHVLHALTVLQHYSRNSIVTLVGDMFVSGMRRRVRHDHRIHDQTEGGRRSSAPTAVRGRR
jgi:hypothetical protein